MHGFKEFFDNNKRYSDHEVIGMYNHDNKKIKEISVATGRSIGEIYRILHNYNIEPNRNKTNHYNVINFSRFGYNIPQIAELTGYTSRNVRYILNRLKTEGV